MHKIKGLNPTGEQVDMVNLSLEGDSFKGVALAGAGKTSTAKLICHSLRMKTLYVCFTKKVADDANNDPDFPNHVTAKTLNSVAYRYTMARFPGRRSRLRNKIYPRDIMSHMDLNYLVASYVIGIVESYCNSADNEISANHINSEIKNATLKLPATQRNKQISNYVVEAKKLWGLIWEDNLGFPLTHSHYLKLFSLNPAPLGYGRIIVDEAQDMNPAGTVIIEAQEGAQVIWIGDENQQIFEWRGAVNHLKNLSLPELSLSSSFRFGEGVAELANIPLKILGGKYKVKGLGPESVINPEKLGDKFTVVGRTNMGLLDDVLVIMSTTSKAIHFPYAKEVKTAVESAVSIKKGEHWKVRHLPFRGVSDWDTFLTIAEVEVEFASMVKLIKKYGENKLLKLINKVESESTEKPEEADVIFTTTHKAKGSEWNEIKICDDFNDVVYADKKSGKINRPELNLLYVAITRAKRVITIDKTLIEKIALLAKKSPVTG